MVEVEAKVNHDEVGITVQRMPETKTSAGVLLRNNHFEPKCQNAEGLFPFFNEAQRTAGCFGGEKIIDKLTIDGKPWE
ncbi:hypothetical protein A1353_24365 [Methylomonas methanica]|uniref:Uncharacterized protein n=1 Tax=Methylomonas methanica TaxID=421 RepID=A0A177LSJ0_METMH|nr:hypothetical protein A1353_24365 [Methylomonas methanica]